MNAENGTEPRTAMLEAQAALDTARKADLEHRKAAFLAAYNALCEQYRMGIVFAPQLGIAPWEDYT